MLLRQVGHIQSDDGDLDICLPGYAPQPLFVGIVEQHNPLRPGRDGEQVAGRADAVAFLVVVSMCGDCVCRAVFTVADLFTILDAQDGIDQLMDVILRGQLAADIVFKPAGLVFVRSQVIAAYVDDVVAAPV